MIVGLTRVRNESLIIADTVDHLLSYCDRVILYDDCSTDDTVEIAARAGGDRIEIILGDEWRLERTVEETRHRGILLERARAIGAEWCLYLDADERLIGDLPKLTADAYRFRLFDGYLTTEHQDTYDGGNLADLWRMWGPEFRDIIMLFRTSKAHYAGLDRREPIITNGQVELAQVFVKHYGKCLSVGHWNETCAYYAEFFPEPYASKWGGRRGKALHTRSDFGQPLYTWPELMRFKADWTRL